METKFKVGDFVRVAQDITKVNSRMDETKKRRITIIEGKKKLAGKIVKITRISRINGVVYYAEGWSFTARMFEDKTFKREILVTKKNGRELIVSEEKYERIRRFVTFREYVYTEI